MSGHGNKLVRLIAPANVGTYSGPDGKTYPMAADRSIEVPEDFVSSLLGRGYVIGGKADLAAATDPEALSPGDAIAKLRAPAKVHSVGAGGREYRVAADGTVDVQTRHVAQLIAAGCEYLSGQELQDWLTARKREGK